MSSALKRLPIALPALTTPTPVSQPRLTAFHVRLVTIAVVRTTPLPLLNAMPATIVLAVPSFPTSSQLLSVLTQLSVPQLPLTVPLALTTPTPLNHHVWLVPQATCVHSAKWAILSIVTSAATVQPTVSHPLLVQLALTTTSLTAKASLIASRVPLASIAPALIRPLLQGIARLAISVYWALSRLHPPPLQLTMARVPLALIARLAQAFPFLAPLELTELLHC